MNVGRQWLVVSVLLLSCGSVEALVLRLESQVKRADNYALQGLMHASERDYRAAISNYIEALKVLPVAKATTQRKELYKRKLNKAILVYCEQEFNSANPRGWLNAVRTVIPYLVGSMLIKCQNK